MKRLRSDSAFVSDKKCAVNATVETSICPHINLLSADVVLYLMGKNFSLERENDVKDVLALLRVAKRWSLVLQPWLLTQLRSSLVTDAVLYSRSFSTVRAFTRNILERPDFRQTAHLTLALTALQLLQREDRCIPVRHPPLNMGPLEHAGGGTSTRSIYYYNRAAAAATGQTPADPIPLQEVEGLEWAAMQTEFYTILHQYNVYRDAVTPRINDDAWWREWEDETRDGRIKLIQSRARARVHIYEMTKETLHHIKLSDLAAYNGGTGWNKCTTDWRNVTLNRTHILSEELDDFRACCFNVVFPAKYEDPTIRNNAIVTFACSDSNHHRLTERMAAYELQAL
jgi:hypothetical protein